jgi:transcriptional regulator with XRE-family HTH domain
MRNSLITVEEGAFMPKKSEWSQRVMGMFPNKTPEQAAELLGLKNPSTFIKHARGYSKSPSLELLEAIANATGLNLHWVITGKGPKYWDAPSPPLIKDASLIQQSETRFKVLLPSLALEISIPDILNLATAEIVAIKPLGKAAKKNLIQKNENRIALSLVSPSGGEERSLDVDQSHDPTSNPESP